MTDRIIIYGNSELTPVLAEYIERNKNQEVIGYTLHSSFIKKPTLYDRPLIPFETLAKEYPPTVFRLHILTQPTYNLSLKHLQQTAKEAIQQGFSLFTYIDPNALVAESAVIDDNCCIFPSAIVEPMAHLESHVILRPGAHIGIASRVGSWSNIGIRAVVTDHQILDPETYLGAMHLYDD